MTLRGVLAVVCVALLAAAGAAGAPNPADLEAELVCPTCDTTLDQSNAPVAQRMKQIIRAQIAAGLTEAEIKAALVDQFGPGVLAEPAEVGVRPPCLGTPARVARRGCARRRDRCMGVVSPAS